jgi:RNA polymerase-interacting CarD/CdnL/TRCF family regulator
MDNFLGRIVLSSDFGSGTVAEIQKMGSPEQEFLVVNHHEGGAKSFIPKENTDRYRFMASVEELDQALGDIREQDEAQDFPSKKDRINYFKKESRIQDLNSIVNLINELRAIDDKGSMEDQVLAKLVKTITLEYSLAHEISIQAARRKINEILK